jgi:protein-disulfide isomerase
VSTGKITYASLQFPLESIHPLALKAGQAAECAARQGEYWRMHERLFADPESLDAGALSDRAALIGLRSTDFSSCLEGETLSKVRSDMAEGRRLGVTGTPTVFFGLSDDTGNVVLYRRITGAPSISLIDTEVQSLIDRRDGRSTTVWQRLKGAILLLFVR